MNIEDIFTDAELALIDSGKYMPGRAVLDAKLDLAAAMEREACAKVCDAKSVLWRVRPMPLLGYSIELEDCAAAIRARRKV
jgi:hypothetical protein